MTSHKAVAGHPYLGLFGLHHGGKCDFSIWHVSTQRNKLQGEAVHYQTTARCAYFVLREVHAVSL